MSNRSLIIIIVSCWVLIAGFYLFQMSRMTSPVAPQLTEERLRLDEIRGVDVYFRGIPYTLNFNQQNLLATIINRTEKIKSETSIVDADDEYTEDIEKIVILRFNNRPPTIIFPLGQKKHCVAFSVPDWSIDHVYIESHCGEFKQLISNILR